MKKISIILTFLLSTIILSSPSYSEWTKVATGTGKSNHGMNTYVNFKNIRKVSNFSYFWSLSDYLKPDRQGNLSAKAYQQGDCMNFRYKLLTVSFHKMPMGIGNSNIIDISKIKKYSDWIYPNVNNIDSIVLKEVCRR